MGELRHEVVVGDEALTHKVIGCAIEVHKQLGPGLLESAYEKCLALELAAQGLGYKAQVDIPITYRGVTIEAAHRLDMVVEGQVILEIKAVEKILPVHEAQLLTYLKLTKLRVGLLINFNSRLLADGLKRLVV